MRVGLVCPYALDVPGGVQAHVLGLARSLRAGGDEVSVLAPLDALGRAASLPPWVVPAGRALALPYNGATARVRIGPRTAATVRRWIVEGAFDVLHVHEPVTPSASLAALWAARSPVVVTFHTASARSRALAAVRPLVADALEGAARLAVSEPARARVLEHLALDSEVVPNGLSTRRFAAARPSPAWQGRPGAPTVAVLGRVDEPRKGLAVLAAALPALRARAPGLRLLVAGPGSWGRLYLAAGAHAGALEALGLVSEAEKAQLLASVDAVVAPHTGGESFGIVLAEAMSAGTPVVASDLPAFATLLDGGRLGTLVPAGDPAGLAAGVLDVLDHPGPARQRAAAAALAAGAYDWSLVGARVRAVYEQVLARSSWPRWGRVEA